MHKRSTYPHVYSSAARMIHILQSVIISQGDRWVSLARTEQRKQPIDLHSLPHTSRLHTFVAGGGYVKKRRS